MVTSKIKLKLNDLVIYGDILVNLLSILSTKSTIYQKIKIGKIGKLISHSCQHIVHVSCKYGHFQVEAGGGGVGGGGGLVSKLLCQKLFADQLIYLQLFFFSH